MIFKQDACMFWAKDGPHVKEKTEFTKGNYSLLLEEVREQEQKTTVGQGAPLAIVQQNDSMGNATITKAAVHQFKDATLLTGTTYLVDDWMALGHAINDMRILDVMFKGVFIDRVVVKRDVTMPNKQSDFVLWVAPFFETIFNASGQRPFPSLFVLNDTFDEGNNAIRLYQDFFEVRTNTSGTSLLRISSRQVCFEKLLMKNNDALCNTCVSKRAAEAYRRAISARQIGYLETKRRNALQEASLSNRAIRAAQFSLDAALAVSVSNTPELAKAAVQAAQASLLAAIEAKAGDERISTSKSDLTNVNLEATSYYYPQQTKTEAASIVILTRHPRSNRHQRNVQEFSDIVNATLSAHQNISFFITIIDSNSPRSFDEQVDLFRSANVLITPHGAAMSNIIHMKNTSLIIELTAARSGRALSTWIRTWFMYSNIADDFGVQLRKVFSDDLNSDYGNSFVINEKESVRCANLIIDFLTFNNNEFAKQQQLQGNETTHLFASSFVPTTFTNGSSSSLRCSSENIIDVELPEE